MFGRVTPTAHGATVDVQIGTSAITRVILAALLAFGGLGSLPVLASAGYPVQVVIAISLALVSFAIFLLRSERVGAGFPRQEAIELERFIDDLFATDAQ